MKTMEKGLHQKFQSPGWQDKETQPCAEAPRRATKIGVGVRIGARSFTRASYFFFFAI